MYRTAWITGAGKGIGRALALRLAAAGTNVAASARTAGDLKGLANEAAGLPGTVTSYVLDVTDSDAVNAAASEILRDFETLDLVVFNAGTHTPITLDTFDPKVFETLWWVNVMGVVHGLAAILPHMTARRDGHVAIVGSVAGYTGLPTGAAYGASKAALINLCEALKPELDGYGIRLSVINPGFVKTPLTERNEFPMPFLIGAEEAAERIHAGLMSGRFEIAFPRRMVWLLKLLRALPTPLRFAVARRMLPR